MFPQSLEELLRRCNEDEEFCLVIDEREDPPLLLIKRATCCALPIIFRLPLIPADHARLNIHLIKEVSFYKNACKEAQNQVEKLEGQISLCKESFGKKFEDLNSSFESKSDQAKAQYDEMIRKYEDQISQLKENHSAEIQKYITQSHANENSLMTNYEKQISELREKQIEESQKLMDVVAKSGRQAEVISAQETQLKDLRQQLAQLEADKKKHADDYNSVLNEKFSIQTELAACKANLAQNEQKYQKLTESSQSQETSLSQLNETIEGKNKEIEELKKLNAELQGKANERDWLAEKSKKVIFKTQSDLKRVVEHHNQKKAEWKAQMDEMLKIEKAAIAQAEENKALKLQM